MTDQYKCQSYYDDDDVLRDCLCGKCGDMPQSKALDELRDKIIDAITLDKHGNPKFYWHQDQVANIKQLLEANKQQWQLEARIDEVAGIPPAYQSLGRYREKRIAQLNSQKDRA
ncbi:hypothetical protein [uncultured Kocuria sp.]|uniref:hypothetical protein n=1 Tax=uncultured Kocuria sp. TaxID=259305 RepID=UPI00261AD9D7|nr:hypothetical protein [uncultured Kocuria sp.]